MSTIYLPFYLIPLKSYKMPTKRHLPVKWEPNLAAAVRKMPTDRELLAEHARLEEAYKQKRDPGPNFLTASDDMHRHIVNTMLDRQTQRTLEEFDLLGDPDGVPTANPRDDADRKRMITDIDRATDRIQKTYTFVQNNEGNWRARHSEHTGTINHFANNVLMGKLNYLQLIRDRLDK
jgi:hypothetical protein